MITVTLALAQDTTSARVAGPAVPVTCPRGRR